MPLTRTDAYGLSVTTTSDAALDAYVRGVDAALAWKANALDLFGQATAADPGLAVAHAGAAACLFLEERFADARAAANAAVAAAADGVSPREQSYADAVARWVSGSALEAERVMREHVRQYPRDLAIVQRLYFVFFWQGKFPDMLDMTTALVPHAGDSSYLLGMHAFALEEAERSTEAIRLAEQAVTRNPDDAWGIHALAHALYESEAYDAGVARLPGLIEACRDLNWFLNHLWWHLVLMRLSRGEYEAVSALSRALFERQPSSIPGDLHDSISLLWRLELAGHPVGDRWQPFTAIGRQRARAPGLLFHAAHIAMALVAGGDWTAAEEQLAHVSQRAFKDSTGLTGEVLMPLVEGIHAFARGDYLHVIERIEPLRGRIVELGGSRAQRDVFHDTLLEACFRAGDMERAERLLAERLARRRDHCWVRRQTAFSR